jgi:hypothetical protein
MIITGYALPFVIYDLPLVFFSLRSLLVIEAIVFSFLVGAPVSTDGVSIIEGMLSLISPSLCLRLLVADFFDSSELLEVKLLILWKINLRIRLFVFLVELLVLVVLHIFISLELRDFLDLALEGHVGLL